MRLIDTATGTLREFANDNEVRYAILSHRWEDDEVSLQDFATAIGRTKKGFAKIKHASEEAQKMNLQYLWVDTCCIDKSSSAELSEAINSMYRWYAQAEICFAYLSDVDSMENLAASMWFTRGWTLQELIAPKAIRFYNKVWRFFGSKAGLQDRLSSIARIPVGILRGQKLTTCSVAQRMSWAADRVTTRLEDMAYCLMGLFEVNMPMLYGEGHRAFTRLQQEIINISDDQSIFAWSTDQPGRRGILAPSPRGFRDCGSVKSTANVSAPHEYAITNAGLSISLPLIPWALNTYLAVLQCVDVSDFKDLMPQYRHDARSLRSGIFIKSTSRDGRFVRTAFQGKDVHHVNLSDNRKNLNPVPLFLLRHLDESDDPSYLYGFLFRNISSALFPSSAHKMRQPAIRSRRTPVEIAWTSDRSDSIQAWLQESRIDQSEEDIINLLKKRRDDVFRQFGSVDPDIVTMVENPYGSQGSVVTLHAGCDAYDTAEAREVYSSCLASATFGFDFHFNPVCVLRKKVTTAQWDGCPFHVSNPCGAAVSESEFDDCQELEALILKSEDSREDSWNKEGIMAIRGQRVHGLLVDLPLLNIRINISEGWKDKSTKAWIVDIAAIDLPSFFDLESRVEAARELELHLQQMEAMQRHAEDGADSSPSTSSTESGEADIRTDGSKFS